MKPLLFTDSDVFAGTERHILELATALRTVNVRAAVACPAGSPLAKRASEASLRVVAVEKRGAIDRAAIRAVSDLLRRGEIDIVHAHNGRTALIGALAKLWAGRGCCVATQHFIEPTRVNRKGVQGWLSRIVHRWVSGRTSRVIAISDAVRRAMLDRGETSGDRVVVVHNGISIPCREQASLDARRDIRSELGAESAPLIVCAARLEAEKSIDTLVEAMPLAAIRHPDVVCAIAGAGSLMGRLRDKVARLGVQRNVRVLGHRDDVALLMAAADVVVLTSMAEPFGLVLLEAMSLSKPVIATRAGGPLEIVDDGVTGLLTEPANPIDLATALDRLLSEPRLRNQFGAAGFQRFRDLFTSAEMAQRTKAVYAAALAGEWEPAMRCASRGVALASMGKGVNEI